MPSLKVAHSRGCAKVGMPRLGQRRPWPGPWRWAGPWVASLIVTESAVNLGLIGEPAARDLLGSAPAAKRASLTHFMLGAGSGSETRVRLFLQQRRFTVRPQVFIPGVGRVDLLVGESLIIECDSEQHHAAGARYRMDRVRDLASGDLATPP